MEFIGFIEIAGQGVAHQKVIKNGLVVPFEYVVNNLRLRGYGRFFLYLFAMQHDTGSGNGFSFVVLAIDDVEGGSGVVGNGSEG